MFKMGSVEAKNDVIDQIENRTKSEITEGLRRKYLQLVREGIERVQNYRGDYMGFSALRDEIYCDLETIRLDMVGSHLLTSGLYNEDILDEKTRLLREISKKSCSFWRCE